MIDLICSLFSATTALDNSYLVYFLELFIKRLMVWWRLFWNNVIQQPWCVNNQICGRTANHIIGEISNSTQKVTWIMQLEWTIFIGLLSFYPDQCQKANNFSLFMSQCWGKKCVKLCPLGYAFDITLQIEKMQICIRTPLFMSYWAPCPFHSCCCMVILCSLKVSGQWKRMQRNITHVLNLTCVCPYE